MSITSARNFIEKSGCGVITAVLLAAVMAIGVFSSCGKQGGQPTEQVANVIPVVTVGKTVVSLDTLDAIYNEDLKNKEQQMQQQAAAGGRPDAFEGLDSIQRSLTYRDSYGQAIDAAINVSMAQAEGITLDDKTVLDEVMKQFNEQIAAFKQQLIQGGQLAANATEEQYLAKFKEVVGKTPTEVTTQQRELLASKLKDKNLAVMLQGAAAQLLWTAKKERDAKISDADLNTIFNSVALKSILLREKPTQDRTAEAEKILAEIKAGTIKFEDAMDKYSDNPVQKDKKKKSEGEDILAWQFLLNDENYGPVMKLKPGEISGVIKGVDGPLIYKLLRVKTSDKPADFDARKEFYRQNHLKFVANNLYYKTIRAERAKLTNWANKGVEAMYKLYTLERDPIVEQDFQGVVTMAKAATSDPASSKAAIIGRFFAANRVWRSFPDKTKPKADFEVAEYIPAMEEFLTLGENPSIRLLLVDLYIARKSDKAGPHLVQAAVGNASLTDTGLALNRQVFTKLDALKKDKLITAELATQVETAQSRWLKDRKSKDEQVAQQQKLLEEEKKAATEREKQAKAEAAKNPPKPAGPSSSDLIAPAPTAPR